MKILVVNSGSSSIKCQLFDTEQDRMMASALAERIGEERARLVFRICLQDGLETNVAQEVEIADHSEGLKRIVDFLTRPTQAVLRNRSEVSAVGHRVVHGGEAFRQSTRIDDRVLQAIRDCFPLAPLHNPPNVLGIETARRVFPGAVQVAVFDTAFHQTMPAEAFLYALPLEFYEKHRIRRYGFHGTSHAYVSEAAARFLGRTPDELNLISIHLGNGASMAAVQRGACIDSTMGFTPLAGLVMGTRPGDIDPYLPIYLASQLGMSWEEIDRIFNHESGLRGLCGTNDMREVVERMRSGDEQARLALEVYTYRIRKSIGALFAALGSLDVLAFTAGIGENVAEVRELSCRELDRLGIVLDPKRNRDMSSGIREIGSESGEVRILVIPANEEWMIAQEVRRIVESCGLPAKRAEMPTS